MRNQKHEIRNKFKTANANVPNDQARGFVHSEFVLGICFGFRASDFGFMIVGTLRVRLLLRESRTLKDKRQVVRSIKDRLRNNFNVSVAEVDALDNRQLAVL